MISLTDRSHPQAGRALLSGALLVCTCAATLPLVPTDAFAQGLDAPAQHAPYVNTIPASRDIPYPGTIVVTIDASDTARGIYTIEEKMPVSAGLLTVFYPAWQPGAHSIQNPAKEIAGLHFLTGEKELEWKRDPVNAYAFQVDVPKGVTTLTVRYQYLSPTDRAQGMIEAVPGVLWLEWSRLILYPAGHYTRQIRVEPHVTIPAGFMVEGALQPSRRDGDTLIFPTTDIDTLFDSPVITASHLRSIPLSDRVQLTLATPEADTKPIKPSVLAGMKALPIEARALFGVEHYGIYKFLAAQIPKGPVLEHHESSEFRLEPGFFQAPMPPAFGDMYAHEYVHSWNGKFMRPDDLWTPDYQTPMRGTKLWIYEGQTELWGLVLAARSGLMSKDNVLGMLAYIAALEQVEQGRGWKSVGDTALDNAHPLHRPLAWRTYQRQEDFYFEGVLIWLEADAIIRERTGGKRSLEDFARMFFGGRDGDAKDHTYNEQDIVRTLQSLCDYDWSGFLRERIEKTGPVSLAGITQGGYALSFTDTPTEFFTDYSERFGTTDLSYAIGLSVEKDGALSDVVWGGPAFDAGMRLGTTIKTVNDQPFSADLLKQAIIAAKDSGVIRLGLDVLGSSRTATIHWKGGLRFPRLMKTSAAPGTLDMLLQPHRR